MPVTEQYTPKDYTGDGANQVFSVPDLWFKQSDVYVLVDGVNTPWTREAGVGVNLATAPADGVSVIIYRETELTQDKDFSIAGRMPANEVSEGFDKQILINQEVEYRSSILPPESTPTTRQNTTVGFDSSGDSVTRTISEEVAHLGIQSSVDAAAASAAASSVSATASAASATQSLSWASSSEEQSGIANSERVLAETAADEAQAAQALSSATLLDLSTRSFPKVRIGSQILGTISSDVTLTFPGGGSLTLKTSARPYTEDNAINAQGNPSAVDFLGDIHNIINGNVIDYDTYATYGLEPSTTVSNYAPIPEWSAEFPIINGVINTTKLDLTYYGGEQVTFTAPSPFVVIDGADLTPLGRLPFVNNLTTTLQGLSQDIPGVEDYVFCEGSASAVTTIRLPRIQDTGATASAVHKVTIVDKDGAASVDNIKVQLNSNDHTAGIEINGVNTSTDANGLITSLINVDYGSATFITNGLGWYRL